MCSSDTFVFQIGYIQVLQIAGLGVNYSISNTTVLEILPGIIYH